jgi:hypothetical protein
MAANGTVNTITGTVMNFEQKQARLADARIDEWAELIH